MPAVDGREMQTQRGGCVAALGVACSRVIAAQTHTTHLCWRKDARSATTKCVCTETTACHAATQAS